MQRHRLRLGRVIRNTTGGTHEAKIIGCGRYYPAPDIKESLSIGFIFLDHLYRGAAWNRAMKALMLEHAFETFDEVWSHIAPANTRSQKAAQKIGAEHTNTADLAVTGAATETLCYRISKTH